MREAMPITAAFIDDFRDAFGADLINGQIKSGMAGDTWEFHASENGRSVGTPLPDVSRISVKLSETVVGSWHKPKKERN